MLFFSSSKVHADDIDEGDELVYSILKREGDRDYFGINSNTGEIVTQALFDRDEPARQIEKFVTIKATDNGKPPLEDLCTIKVTILDINDNSPIFDKAVSNSFYQPC